MSDTTLRGVVANTSLPGVVQGSSVLTRHNSRGELIVPHWATQMAADGRAFQISNPTVNTALACGGTSFSATAPAFTLDVASGTTMIPERVAFVQGGTVAGADIFIILTYDKIARFSSGGTAIVPKPRRTDGPVSSAVTAYYGTTAGAITAVTASSPQEFAHDSMAADVTLGANVYEKNLFIWPQVPDVGAPVLVGPASLVIYAWAATTQPSWFFNIVWVEIPTPSL